MESKESCDNCKCQSKVINSAKNVSEIKKVVPKRRTNQIPDDILSNQSLNEMISILPSNYNFEIHKTVHKIREVLYIIIFM